MKILKLIFDNRFVLYFTENQQYTNNTLTTMAKNYFKNIMSFLKNNSKNTKKIFFSFLFVLLFAHNSIGQVTITKPNLPITVCSGFPSAYNNLGNIVITETANTNFSNTAGARSLVFTIPTNFEFNPSVGTATGNGQNVTITSTVVTATQITINYTCTATNKADVVTISGIQVRAINVASTGNITCTAVNTGTVNGLVVGTTLTNTLTSTVQSTPTIANASTDQSLTACTTTATLAGNTPTSGAGLWTVIAGTATITTPSSPTSGITGLALNATATLRWTISNGCGSSFDDVDITTISGPGCHVYCTPTSTGNTYPISNVTFAGINNNSSATVTAGPFYQDFSAITGNVTAGNTYTFTATATGVSPNSFGIYVFADWNNNGDFSDDAGPYTIGTYTTNSATLSGSITIPIDAYIGTTRIRVANQFNVVPSPCPTAGTFQDEDYSLTITAAPPCVAPTTQPTVLILTPSGTSISGSFTAAPPTAPQGYLVVMNTTGVAPTGLISNGTTYAIGSSIGVGNTVVDTDTNTTFIAGGLNNLTTYYFYVYSMNNICTGGPLYNTNPTVLINNATTTAVTPTPCIPVTTSPQNSSKYISRVAFIGTLNDTNNTSTFSAITLGYQDFTGLATKAIQAQGEGVNLIVESTGGRAKLKAWIDWNKDGDYDDSGEFIYGPGSAGISSTFGFVIPSGTVPGDYRIRVRTYNSFYNDGNPMNGNPDEYFGYNFNSCEIFDGGTFSGFPTTEYGEAEDYLFTVIQRCDANITSTTEGQVCGSGTTTLTATATAGTTQYRWYAAATGGAQLTGSPTATGSWTTPSIGTTTTYYVTAWNGSCESLVRTPVIARVNPIPTLTFTPAAPEVCGENTIVTLTAGGDKQQFDLINEKFEGGSLGVFSNVNSDANSATIDGQTKWTNRNSTYIPNGNSWKPAISTGLAPNKFALATSDSPTRPTNDVENSLITGVLNSSGYLNLTLDLKFYYSRYYPDATNTTEEYVAIQVSTNGGGAWTDIQRFTADTGIGTQFTSLSYPINGYINQTNLKFRVIHHSFADATGMLPDGVAIDDVRVYGDKALNTAFDWSGASLPDAYTDAACTISYTTGTPLATVYVKPTLAQLEMGTYTFTASAILANGCTASTPITITNKSKVWKGTTNNDWNTASNWLPVGVPDANTCVVIPTGTTSKIMNTPDALAKNLTVKAPTGNLELQTSKNLTVTDFIKVEAGATFNVRDNANLVQINDVANTGNINMERIANIRSLDFVYWSTPVNSFSTSAISPLTAASNIYKWEPTTVTGYTSNFGNWAFANETMVLGKGYIVRGPSTYTSTLQDYTATFTGVPNNGSKTTSILRSTYTGAPYSGPTATLVTLNDDNWNLLGNPYPSSISADSFLSTNSANLAGFIKIWTHGALPVSAIDSFYEHYAYNYVSSDYITYNLLGGTVPGFDGYIPAGQGFFVLMNDAATTSETVSFTNSMRNSSYRNDQFYRNSESNTKNRIWIDLLDSNNVSTRTLLGYATNATDGFDNLYDAIAMGVKSKFELYSLIDSAEMKIQGKSLPFNQNDKILLGFSAPKNDTYTIAIASLDGLFKDKNQKIFLEDTYLKKTYDLTDAPYQFSADMGRFNDRFILKYSKKESGPDTSSLSDINVSTSTTINVKSNIYNITEVEIFDIQGKRLFNSENIGNKELEIIQLKPTLNVLLVKVTLENGEVQTKKIIY